MKNYIHNVLVRIKSNKYNFIIKTNIKFSHFLIDELIRQITINCAERGLLLLRVRDEARMTITAYETLYESSIAYGVRKALIAEQKKIELDNKIKELNTSKRELQQQVENLKASIDLTLARSQEKRELEEKAHAEEVS